MVTVTESIDCLRVKCWMGEAAAVPVARTHVVVLMVQDGTVKVTVGLLVYPVPAAVTVTETTSMKTPGVAELVRVACTHVVPVMVQDGGAEVTAGRPVSPAPGLVTVTP